MGYSTHKNSSMAQEQNYQVNYTINVEATEGTRKVQAFADSIKSLILAKNDLTPAVNNIQKMMNDVDKIFRTKSGKKRDYTYKMDITMLFASFRVNPLHFPHLRLADKSQYQIDETGLQNT